MNYNNQTIYTLIGSFLLVALLPSCGQNSGQKSSSISKRVDLLYNQAQQRHSKALELISQTPNNIPATRKKLKEFLLIHNDSLDKKNKKKLLKSSTNSDFPYLQYKSLIDSDINRLQRCVKKLEEHPNALSQTWSLKITKLIEKLETLNTTLIITDEYHTEKIRRADNRSGKLFSFVGGGLFTVVRKLFFMGL